MSYSDKDYKKMNKKQLFQIIKNYESAYKHLEKKYKYADALLNHVVNHARKAEELSNKLSLELFTVFNNPVPKSERVE